MQKYLYNKVHKSFARNLRQKQTFVEQKLWKHLRGKQVGHKFRRQFPLYGYIVDFYCHELKLIIELDGSSHTESKYIYDVKRQEYLELKGCKFLRFTEYEVMESSDNVLQTIENFINGYLN